MIDYSEQLLITHPSGRQEALALKQGALRVGSAADNDLVLLGSSIASHHAVLRLGEQGDLRISIAGIEIELPRASAGSAVLRIGGYVLHYATVSPAAQPASYVLRAADQPVQFARTDEAALLSNLLSQAASQATGRRVLDTHEADTIEMTAIKAGA